METESSACREINAPSRLSVTVRILLFLLGWSSTSFILEEEHGTQEEEESKAGLVDP